MDTIPLKEHNIIVDDAIIVSIELIEVYGNPLYLSLSGNRDRGISFSRELSHDHWKVFNDTNLNYSLLTSYPENNTTEKKLRPFPQNLTLLWDTSLRMKDRNFEAESKLLKKYLSVLKNRRKSTSLNIISWSKNKKIEKQFLLSDTPFKVIKDYLSDSFYNGSQSKLDLDETFTPFPDVILLFSDGRSTLNRSGRNERGSRIYDQ